MCAIAGACTHNPEVNATNITFMALNEMQHRGEYSTGIVSQSYDGSFEEQREIGAVKDAYPRDELDRLAGKIALGMNRYPTFTRGHHDVPVIDEPVGLSLGHNGTLTETNELEYFLSRGGIDTEKINDTPMMGYALGQLLREGHELPDAVVKLYPLLKGAFSCVAQHRDTLVAFRDAQGLRPLAKAKIKDGHAFASETCGFYPTRSKQNGIVEPGELVVVTNGKLERIQISEPNPKLDIFEIVYFSRADSELFGESVGSMRFRIGQELADQFPLVGDNYLVVGVPDSGLPIAEGFARNRGIEKRDVLLKHRYNGGRSFLQPSQKQRQQYINSKFSYISGPAKGRDVIVIDDSIVRLNTAIRINRLMMRAGARSVSFLVGSPPIGYPDFSGIDTPKQRELVASYLRPEEIRKRIGCKFLGYLSLERLIRATGQSAEVFNLSCFNGEYPYEIGNKIKAIKEPASLEFLEDAWAEAA